MDKPLTFGSLFAGIGGIDLGFERAGMVCKWQVEIDDYATKVLEKHWPAVHRERDVRECGRHNLERVDVIAGGFPCQDLSNMGRQAGLAGSRSGLWFEFERIIRDLRPQFVVVENVANHGLRWLREVLGGLATLRFNAEWACLSPCMFGVPQRRNRIFIVAYADRWFRSLTHKRAILHRKKPPEHAGFTKPDAQRVRANHGVSDRLDVGKRISSCSNAVVPQIAEFIGRAIVEAAK